MKHLRGLIFQVRMNEPEMDTLRSLAELSARTPSEVVRELLRAEAEARGIWRQTETESSIKLEQRKVEEMDTDYVKLKIVLTEEERRGLERLADEEFRAPWQQVRWILRRELLRRGLIEARPEDAQEDNE